MPSLRAVAATAAVLATFVLTASAGAWAPASTATVHPGVNTDTQGGSCTSNFIYTQGADVYIGQAAHCSSTGAATDTDGCVAQSLPEGTPVQVDGASQPGTLVYNSWIRMQRRGETDPDACAYNDLALVKLAAADVAKVNPSIPFWGGPTGITATVADGSKVLSYGNSILRAGITQLSPKEGASLGQSANGWTHQVFTATPGIPGDSGSAFIDGSGKAFGVLSTLAAAPVPLSNGVGDLSHELAYLHSVPGFEGVQLALGTVAFRGPLLPL
jgi:hypothetical protein